MPVSSRVFVLNYNGQALLAECLPSVVQAARTADFPCQVTVIDNGSSDSSVKYLRECWPDVQIRQCSNRGLVSFNDAVREMDEPVALLLNNDVRLDPHCVGRLVAAFERHPDCFLAGPRCWSFDGRRYEGTRSALCFRRGLVHTWLRPPEGSELGAEADAAGRWDEGPGHDYTASAGAVLAVRRSMFLDLGGFDPLFLPGRFEDLDLAFRGWLAGWKAYYVPEAVAYHLGRATFDRALSNDRSLELDTRNALLFAWKNLREPWHMAWHAGFLLLRLFRACVLVQPPVLRGMLGALRRIPQTRASRAVPQRRVRTERELFGLLR
jgi:GT2 family glycosyltransferase